MHCVSSKACQQHATDEEECEIVGHSGRLGQVFKTPGGSVVCQWEQCLFGARVMLQTRGSVAYDDIEQHEGAAWERRVDDSDP